MTEVCAKRAASAKSRALRGRASAYNRSDVLADAHLFAAALGIVLPDAVRLGERAVDLAAGLEAEPLEDGGRMITWRDPSRASLSIVLDADGRVRSVLPFLDGARELQGRLIELFEDPHERADDCIVVDFVTKDGAFAFRTGTHAQDLHVNRERLQFELPMPVSVTAFARKYMVRPPEAPSAVKELGDAPTRWVSTGLTAARQGRQDFSPARALVRAEIRDCEQRINRATRETFQRARLFCQGLKLDVVAAFDESKPHMVFRPGQVLEGSLALLSTLDTEHHDYTMPLLKTVKGEIGG